MRPLLRLAKREATAMILSEQERFDALFDAKTCKR